MGKKLFSYIVAGLIASVVIAGCGGDDDSGESEASAAPAAAVEVAGTEVEADSDLNANLPEEIREAGEIEIGSSAPYPPWAYCPDGSEDCEPSEWIGLDADIGKAIGARLGIDWTWVKTKFDGLIPAVVSGRNQGLMSALHDTAERREAISFADYVTVGSAFLVEAGNPEDVSDLESVCGKTLVVQSQSAQVQYVNGFQSECEAAGLPEIETLALPDTAACVLAVETGKGVAFFSDKVALTYLAEETESSDLEVVSSEDKGYDVSPVGIGVLKDNMPLAEALQAGIQSLIDDGTYDAILDEYGYGFVGTDTATVNDGA